MIQPFRANYKSDIWRKRERINKTQNNKVRMNQKQQFASYNQIATTNGGYLFHSKSFNI